MTVCECRPDPYRRNSRLLLKRDPASLMGQAGERNVGDGDVRPHPLGLQVEQRSYLEIMLGSSNALLDHLELAIAGEQIGTNCAGGVLNNAFQPVTAGILLDLVIICFQPYVSVHLVEPREDAPTARESPEQSFDLVPQLLGFPVVVPFDFPVRLRRHDRRHPEVADELAGLVAFAGAVHRQRPVRNRVCPALQ